MKTSTVTASNYLVLALAALIAVCAIGLGAGSAGAAWPGSNGPIVFAGGEEGSRTGLWSIKANGKGLRHLTTNATDNEPQISRDGRFIVFTRTVDVGGRHVFIARADGSAVREVTKGGDRTPSFSRSDDRILFSRTTGPAADEKFPSQEHIFSIRRDGSGLHRLTFGDDVSDRNPVASPNGRIIAFDRWTVGPMRQVYTMRTDGSRVKRAARGFVGWTSQADFSPSGNRIVFVRGFPGSSKAELYTMRPDGEKVRRLTGKANDPLGFFSDPSYSPDGRFVVASHKPGAKFTKLVVIRVRDRSRVETLGAGRTPRSPDMFDPAWLAR